MSPVFHMRTELVANVVSSPLMNTIADLFKFKRTHQQMCLLASPLLSH